VRSFPDTIVFSAEGGATGHRLRPKPGDEKLMVERVPPHQVDIVAQSIVLMSYLSRPR